MVENVEFRIKRQQDIVSSMAGYLSSHTSLINDFSEGSITRSLLEAIAQEMFRQNITYAQGVTDAIRTSIKQAFNQPLRDAQKAYGDYTIYRKKLASPSNVSVSFTSTGSTFNGYISGTVLTVVSMTSGQIVVGHTLTGGSTTSGTQISAFLTGSGGIGTYSVTISQTVGASNNTTSFTSFGSLLRPDTVTVQAGTASGSLVAGTYYYSVSCLFGTNENLASNISSVTTTVTQQVNLSWNAVPNATSYRVYRSTNQYMLNSVYYTVSNATSYTDTGSAATKGRWPTTKYSWGVAATNITNGVAATSLGSYVRSIPTNNTAIVSWNKVDAADSASAVTGYKVYRSFYDLGLNTVDPLTVTLSSGGTTLNYGASFTGSISGTNLTVASVQSGTMASGQVLSGSNIVSGTYIVSQTSGTTGGAGVYVISSSQTVSSTSGLIATMTYYYSVTALTSDGESLGSVAMPIVLNASYRTVALSWAANSSAIGYRIYRSNFSTFSSAAHYDTTDTTFVDDGSLVTNSTVSWPTASIVGTVSSSTVVNGVSVWRLVDPDIHFGSLADWPKTSTAFSIQGPIVVPPGTQVNVPGTSKTYLFVSKITMPATSSSYTATIESLLYGTVGNTPPNTITQFSSPVYGLESGTNSMAFTNGSDLETEDEWRIRFGQTIKDLARGTKYSLEVGALNGKIYDTNGFVTERVTRALVVESANQVITIYIHNGTLTSSSNNLVTQTQKIINGYTDDQGTKQPGYKPAGIPVSVQAATTQAQNIYVETTLSPGYTLDLVKTDIKNNIIQYFLDLGISDGLYQPIITSIAPTGTPGSNSYQYKIVAITSTGDKSLVSDSKTISNASTVLSNLLTWSVLTGGPTISYYDILRWDGSQWGLVATIPTSAPYLAGSQMTYTDTAVSVSSYAFSPPVIQVFQKSSLTQLILQTPGISSVIVNALTSGGVDQNVIIPSVGIIPIIGEIVIK